MQTPEDLSSRIQSWKRSRVSTPAFAKNAPNHLAIILFQELFGLIHDLKTSLQMSPSATLRAIGDTAIEIDSHLGALARAERTLAPEDSAALRTLCANLENLESLNVFLERSAPRSSPLERVQPERWKELSGPRYTWDSLSVARLTYANLACLALAERATELPLDQLATHDRQIGDEAARLQGLVVAKQVTPSPLPASEGLRLNWLTLGAFPSSSIEGLDGAWHRLPLFR